MKRLLGLLLALALLPLLAAPAASVTCPYSGCEHPRVHLRVPTSPVPQGTRPVIRFQVRPLSGNAQPVGKVVLVVKRRGGGFSWTRTAFVDGPARDFRTPRLTKRGKYAVTATFTGKPDAFWLGASATKSFRVVRKP